jgi:deazaflavin-dependent oxidoreductase (nitroreductase family)
MTNNNTATQVAPPPKMPLWILDAQVFLLRRRLMGPMNKLLMVITTTGRKSGKQIARPIGYQADADSFLAFNIGGQSNWYKNMLSNPKVKLEIQGKTHHATGAVLTDDAEILAAIELYKTHQPSTLTRFFKLELTATPAEMLAIKNRIIFVRFRPTA